MTLPSLSAHPEPPRLPPTTSPWSPGQPSYLAVCGADWQPDVGGDDHGEGRGQFDGEATIGEMGGRQGTARGSPEPPGGLVRTAPEPGHRSSITQLSLRGRAQPKERVLSPCWVFRNLT